MSIVNDYRLKLGAKEFVPIVIGGMGVNISTSELALEACRLGGIGHISDAMVFVVADRKFGTDFSTSKYEKNKAYKQSFDKSCVKFDLEDLYRAQKMQVQHTMEKKRGGGAVFINIMEKLTMADPLSTLETRLRAALDGGIDGITLSAGLHTHSLSLMESHPRFRDVKIGIVVSSLRALKIFLRGAQRAARLPDYVVIEGPLAGGHLGFGPDWKERNLGSIVDEVVGFLKDEDLKIPVIAAGGVFTGGDAVALLERGAAGVQVATRFTVTHECGLPDDVKQEYFKASPQDVIVSTCSPTGYLIRVLATSPCLGSMVKPNCEAFGYVLSKEGKCQYLDAYRQALLSTGANRLPVQEKICLCYHFSRYGCYTCGGNVHRLKETSVMSEDGSYKLLTAEDVFLDYQFSRGKEIRLPLSVGKSFTTTECLPNLTNRYGRKPNNSNSKEFVKITLR